MSFPNGSIIVDVFGGSGILSHLFSILYPNCTIIYNDYDYYTRLFKPEVIEKINRILQYSRDVMEKKQYKTRSNYTRWNL